MAFGSLLLGPVFGTVCYAGPQEQAGHVGSNMTNADNNQDTSRNSASGDLPATPAPHAGDYDNSVGLPLLKHIVDDQKAIWTSPAHLHWQDADWLLPLGVVAGGLFATDTEFSKHLSNSPSRLKNSRDLSNYGLGAMVGAGGLLYLWGRATHDDHKRETGFLAGEAAIDSLLDAEAIKLVTGRQRPLDGMPQYQGDFFQGGASFPSEHSAAAWSIAGIFSHEYQTPLVELASYGLASAISTSRITAKQHFPSDVLIGGVLGYLTAREVYRRHHDPALGGRDWTTYAENRREEPRSTSFGSPFVPLDNWVYPLFERLAALGYTDTEFLDMRPWTRIECANLVQEASDRLIDGGPDQSEAEGLIETLKMEFADELATISGESNTRVRVESVYSRSMDIDGKPLNDSYHFGETVINDFGRPYQEGYNNVSGFSGYGTAGRFSIYVRGEYQHAPSAPAYSPAIQQYFSSIDGTPLQPAVPFSTINQFTLLDTYVGANYDNWEFTFGKQSLWWSPDEGSALIFSDNAEPIYMFRVSRVAPFTLPWFFHLLGPAKIDAFVGKLSGNEFPPRPAIHGEKVSFKPTPNLELGFTRTAEFGGVGRPLTLHAIENTYLSYISSGASEYNNSDSPGKRTGGFNFSYKLPLMRNWVTMYADAISSDDPSPLAAPRRAAINPGIYLARLPGVLKMDLRFEAVNTDPDTGRSNGGQFYYWDAVFYHHLYLNNRKLIGSWIGREGQGYQAWTTYHFSPRNGLQFGYRHATVAPDFIPHGESVNDGFVDVNWWVRDDFSVGASVQYEKWFAPFLAPTPQTDWTSSVELAFWPHSWTW